MMIWTQTLVSGNKQGGESENRELTPPFAFADRFWWTDRGRPFYGVGASVHACVKGRSPLFREKKKGQSRPDSLRAYLVDDNFYRNIFIYIW